MNMLQKIVRLKFSCSRRGLWSLILGSLALFALPPWFAMAQSQDDKPKSFKAAASKKLQTEVKPATKDGTRNATTAAGQLDRTQVEFYPEPSAKEKEIIRLLDMPATFTFTKESLVVVADTVMKQHGFDILIDEVKLPEQGVRMDAKDITLKVANMPLRSALRNMLQPKNLAYVVEDDVLKITTKVEYENVWLTRTYPVRDLAGVEPEGYKSLMEAIKQGVTPGVWKDAVAASAAGANLRFHNNTCTISIVPASGSLMIRHSWHGHDEVLKQLRALRKAKNLSSGK